MIKRKRNYREQLLSWKSWWLFIVVRHNDKVCYCLFNSSSFGCRSQCFDSLLLVFWLCITISIAVFGVTWSSFRWEAGLSAVCCSTVLLLCFLIVSTHASAIPVDVVRVKSSTDACTSVGLSINFTSFLVDNIMAGLVGLLWNGWSVLVWWSL